MTKTCDRCKSGQLPIKEFCFTGKYAPHIWRICDHCMEQIELENKTFIPEQLAKKIYDPNEITIWERIKNWWNK